MQLYKMKFFEMQDKSPLVADVVSPSMSERSVDNTVVLQALENGLRATRFLILPVPYSLPSGVL